MAWQTIKSYYTNTNMMRAYHDEDNVAGKHWLVADAVHGPEMMVVGGTISSNVITPGMTSNASILIGIPYLDFSANTNKEHTTNTIRIIMIQQICLNNVRERKWKTKKANKNILKFIRRKPFANIVTTFSHETQP